MDMNNFSNNPTIARKQMLRNRRAQALEEWNRFKSADEPTTSLKEEKILTPAMQRKKQIQAERSSKLAEENYLSEMSVSALTTFMTILVESSLMYDLDEFKQYQPNLHEDIKSMVKSFVTNAGIKTNLKNKNTQKLIECISDIISTNKTLTEEEVEKIILDRTSSDEEIDKAIGELQYDTTDRVAEIVQDDADRISEINDEIAEIELINEPDEEDGQIVDAGEGVEADNPAAEVMSYEGEVVTENVLFTNTRGRIEISKNTKPVQNKLRSQQLITEHYCEGLLEALAVKEGLSLIESGQEYSSDVALGKALTYLTIVEAFNVSGLVEMTASDYNELAALSGAGLKRFRSVVIKEDGIGDIAMVDKPMMRTEPPKTKTLDNPTEGDKTEAEELDEETIELDIDDVNYEDGRDFGGYEDSPEGTGIASQKDGISESALRALLFEKYGSAMDDCGEFTKRFTMAGYIKLANGNFVKI